MDKRHSSLSCAECRLESGHAFLIEGLHVSRSPEGMVFPGENRPHLSMLPYRNVVHRDRPAGNVFKVSADQLLIR